MDDRCRLYLISPPSLEPEIFADQLEQALQSGDVACFQLRLKGASDDFVLAAGRKLMPVCRAHDVVFIVNDRADLAKDLGADGVHLGQTDGSVAEARALLGFEREIGVTCHDSIHLAYEAGEAGADYVAFGAFYPTETKPSTHSPEVELLAVFSEATEVPVVAIGGITAENCAPLVQAGAHFLAVCAGVWNHADGPEGGVKAINLAIDEANSSD